MNKGTLTGGVVKEATSAYTQRTEDAPSIRRVQFSIAVGDSRGGRTFWNCEAEGDDARLDFIVGQCWPGRGIKLDFELASRPFYKGTGKNRVHTGESRFLRVIDIEFAPERSAVPEPVEAGT